MAIRRFGGGLILLALLLSGVMMTPATRSFLVEAQTPQGQSAALDGGTGAPGGGVENAGEPDSFETAALDSVLADTAAVVSEAPDDTTAALDSVLADTAAVVSEAPDDTLVTDSAGVAVGAPDDSTEIAGAADSLGTAARQPPDGLPTGELSDVPGMDFLTAPLERDEFGFLAAWRAGADDTATVRPFEPAAQWHPIQEPLLFRLVRRAGARRFVRDELGLRPDFFAASDSIAVVLDARADSLVAEGVVADGIFFRASLSGGLRFLPPALPALAKRPLVTKEHSVDLDAARITRTHLWKNSEVFPRVTESYAAYLTRLTRRQAHVLWQAEIERVMKAATVEGGRAGLVRISLPFDLPPAIKSIFGEGTPNLSVRGSERISFGGRSQWFPHRPTTEFQRKPSKFPQLEMEQELTIQLKGTIGDKLDVDVDQASQAASPLANKIKIHYRGYEDEIIKRVDFGNTSLNLPGTEYVSYGGRHTGLFGINTEVQFGDVTLNMIMSKEEGEAAEKSTSIRSEQQLKRIYDYEFIRNRFFFLDDATVDAYPDDPAWVAQIDPTTVELWLDDGDGKTQEDFATTPGVAVLGLRSPTPTAADTVVSDTLYFERLEINRDYVLYIDDRFENEKLEVHPYIVLQRYLDDRSTLAVTYYDEGLEQDIGGLDADILYAKMIRPKDEKVSAGMNDGPWGPTNRLMLKNVYSLHPGAANWTEEGLPEASILKEGFEMSIHYKGTVAGAEDPDELAGVKVIRYLGLDSYEETDTGYQLGQDGRVDFGRWIDQGRGLIYFPDLEPFAPVEGSLRGRPQADYPWEILPEEFRNPGVYDRKTCVRRRQAPGSDTTWTSRFYIEIKYRTPVTEVRIDAWDIIEGSEVVTVGGRRLAKDRDYRIDYQTGIIHLYDEAAIGEDEEINVTYKHAGGFGSVSKTLLGVAARYDPEDSKVSMSTSWLYERRGSPDRRPRLGSEPTRITVGEFAGGYRTESMLLTRLLDRLPILTARKPSHISLQGGVGISSPNPNTRNDLYIDDFEGVADDIFVRLNRMSWKASSIPLAVGGADDTRRAARRGEMCWYTPYRAVQEGDLNPTLEYQEANDYRTVLEMQLWPYTGLLDTLGTETCPPESSWVGITQNLSRTSLDLTRARFLDVWINDFVSWDAFQADTTLRSGVMYVELGRISEDAIWERRPIDCNTHEIIGGPAAPPNMRLDSEDANNDGELDLSDANNEDTGLDGVLQQDGPHSVLIDDYGFSGDAETSYDADPELCEVYAEINGTEGNARLDTEDLDGDNSLSQESSYFQFRVDLGDTTYVETDVERDYAESKWNPSGWRRIRIPLSDPYVDDFVNNPSWEDVKHIRVWFTGLTPLQTGAWPGRARMQIATIEIRSNRWVSEAIRDTAGVLVPAEEIQVNEEDFFPGVFNNKENADVYSAPFQEHRERGGNNVLEREQSLTTELRNFQPGHVGRLYMPFLRDQDYMGYEFLEFWLNSTLPEENDAEFFMRLCKDSNSDSTHYYEYRVPVPKIESQDKRRGTWLAVKIRLTDLSDLKRAGLPDSVEVGQAYDDSAWISMKGHPYLTKIGRITLGVVNTGAEPIENANVWIDELRLTHVHKEVDYAYRAQIRAAFSDIGKFDLSYKRIGADFASISGGGFRRRKETETSLNSSISLALGRFGPEDLKLRLPFNAQHSRTRRVPKYRTNDDLLVEDKPDDRDISETANRSYSLSISREKARGGILKYTLDCFSLSGSYKKSISATPHGRDTTRTRAMSVGFGFPFGPWADWNIYRNWRVRLLPTSFSVNLSRSWRDEARYRRLNADINEPYVLDDRRSVRSGGVAIKFGLRPIQAITYNFGQSRDLMLSHRADWLGGVNIGRETSRDENLSANYTLRIFGDWIEPRLSWRSSFKGNFNKQENVGGASLERVTNLHNTRTASIASEIPLRRLLEELGKAGSGLGKAAGEKEPEDEAEGSQKGGTENGSRTKGSTRTSAGGGRTSGSRSFLGKLIRLNRTSGSLSVSEQSTYSRMKGEPTLAYQLGLSLDPEVTALSSSRDSRGKSRALKFEGDFKILRDIGIVAKYEHSMSESRATGSRTGQTETLWPELDFRWGDLSRKLGIKRYVKSMKTSTRFSRRQKQTTREADITKREVTSLWSPIVDLSVSLKSGFSFVLRVDYTGTHSEDLSGVGRTTDRTSTRFKFSAKKSLEITREITVPLTKTKQRIKSRLDVGLEIKLDQSKHTSRQGGQKPQVMGDGRKFDFALTGSYQFSKSVTGHSSITLGESADNKNKTRSSRYVGVRVSASFSF